MHSMASWAAVVMVMPFQTTSMPLPFSSKTLLSQLITVNTGSTPSFSATSLAMSASKPIQLPSAS